jgi:hypothetical protein
MFDAKKQHTEFPRHWEAAKKVILREGLWVLADGSMDALNVSRKNKEMAISKM